MRLCPEPDGEGGGRFGAYRLNLREDISSDFSILYRLMIVTQTPGL